MISPSLLRYHMEGLSKFITILPGGGVLPIYYNITMGGGVSRDPKFVLRNIWTAPNISDINYIYQVIQIKEAYTSSSTSFLSGQNIC